MSSVERSIERRNRLLAAVLLGLTLVTGAFAGIVADRFYLFKKGMLLPYPAIRAITPRVLDLLDKELELTPEQHRQVSEILVRRREVIEKKMVEIQPVVRGEIEEASREIEELLTPGQRESFRKLRDRWEARTTPLEPDQFHRR